MLKRQHHLQRNYGAGNVAAAGSIIEALGNVTPGIQMPALRRDMAEQGARIGQRSQRHDVGDLERLGQGSRPVRAGQRNAPHYLALIDAWLWAPLFIGPWHPWIEATPKTLVLSRPKIEGQKSRHHQGN
jgi:hypothetical protein